MKFWELCSPQKWSFTDLLQNGLKGLQLYKNENPKQMFSNEICAILKNNFFTEHLWRLLLSPKQLKRNKKIF